MEIAGLNPVGSAIILFSILNATSKKKPGKRTKQPYILFFCHLGFVAQLAEQRSEEPCVGSSILPEATILIKSNNLILNYKG